MVWFLQSSEFQYLFNTVIFFSSIPMKNLQIQKAVFIHKLYLKLYSVYLRSVQDKLPALRRSNFLNAANKFTVRGSIPKPYYFQLHHFSADSVYLKIGGSNKFQSPQTCSVSRWICSCFFSNLFSIRYSNNLVVLVPT